MTEKFSGKTDKTHWHRAARQGVLYDPFANLKVNHAFSSLSIKLETVSPVFRKLSVN